MDACALDHSRLPPPHHMYENTTSCYISVICLLMALAALGQCQYLPVQSVMSCRHCEYLLFDLGEFKDEDIQRFYVRHNILNHQTCCQKCQNSVEIKNWRFLCLKKISVNNTEEECGWRVSAKVGSFVGKSKLPNKTLFRLIYSFILLNKPCQYLLQTHLQLNPHTIVDLYSFIKEVYINDAICNSVQIGGTGEVVHIDEGKIGTRKNNCSRPVKGNWVLGGIQRNSRLSFLVSVKKRNRATLIRLIRKWVKPGTQIITECLEHYNTLNSYNFTHITVNHSRQFMDPVSGPHTNNIERAWRDIRGRVPKSGARTKNFVGYLAEYMFQRRYIPEERIHHFFFAAAKLYPPKI